MRLIPARRSMLTAALALLALSATEARAQFSNYFYFGDSFSDTGNALLGTTFVSQFPGSGVTPLPPSPPYAPGRFSNGPVWVDYFAAGVGRPQSALPGGLLIPAVPPILPAPLPLLPPPGQRGNNYSIGGARTGTDGLVPGTGVQVQVGFFLSQTPVVDPNALYIVTAGGNDILAAARAGNPAAAGNAAIQLGAAIQGLYNAGARNFLVPNLPNVGLAPTLVAEGLGGLGTSATLFFNGALAQALGTIGAQPGASIRTLDFFALSNAIAADAQNGGLIYGITNIATPCLPGFLNSPGANCNTSLFADDLHPTSRAHQIYASAVIAQVVPEPATIWLTGTALVGLAAAGVRRRRAAR